MKRLFRWYAGYQYVGGVIAYPRGWGWLRRSHWISALHVTRIIVYDWDHGGRERIEHVIRQRLIYGTGLAKIKWSSESDERD